MMTALTIIHVVISIALIIVVLMQHGKQRGLSGAIAGGAETFFGKNKGRTIDAMLKKFTAIIAILFVASSIILATISINQYKAENEVSDTPQVQTPDQHPFTGKIFIADDGSELIVNPDGTFSDEDGNIYTTDENTSDVIDKDGNIKMNTDSYAKQTVAILEQDEPTETPAE